KMARNFEFIKDITDRKDLWKIAVKVKDKWSAMKEGKMYFEMVVVDSKVDLSGSDEIDPDKLEMKTPPKRLGEELMSSSQKADAKELIGSKLFSTKLMKIPKKE
ncbi:replication protein A1-like protein, partial [Trifolium medium]|nr:replication protein A1-like protein [Trifolium medium]